MRISDFAVALVPDAGLGNKLYVWARAWQFARVNSIPFQCFGWTRPKLGPFLRMERSTRLYLGDIRRESPFAAIACVFRWLAFQRLYDPEVEPLAPSRRRRLFIFRRLSANSVNIATNSFVSLTDCRDELRAALGKRLTSASLKRLARNPKPVVGIHVRRGDIRFCGDYWQPIENFCRRLHNLREVAGACLPAVVFSDGTKGELGPLLLMPSVARAPANPDIVELIQLSRSQVLITSRGSTFSNWAAFLSDGVVLRDPMHCHQPSRPNSVNDLWYEGSAPDDLALWPTQAKHNLRAIASTYITSATQEPTNGA